VTITTVLCLTSWKHDWFKLANLFSPVNNWFDCASYCIDVKCIFDPSWHLRVKLEWFNWFCFRSFCPPTSGFNFDRQVRKCYRKYVDMFLVRWVANFLWASWLCAKCGAVFIKVYLMAFKRYVASQYFATLMESSPDVTSLMCHNIFNIRVTEETDFLRHNTGVIMWLVSSRASAASQSKLLWTTLRFP
jgi:hypothetical protein